MDFRSAGANSGSDLWKERAEHWSNMFERVKEENARMKAELSRVGAEMERGWVRVEEVEQVRAENCRLRERIDAGGLASSSPPHPPPSRSRFSLRSLLCVLGTLLALSSMSLFYWYFTDFSYFQPRQLFFNLKVDTKVSVTEQPQPPAAPAAPGVSEVSPPFAYAEGDYGSAKPASDLAEGTYYVLHNGVRFPKVFLGTAALNHPYLTTKMALSLGYQAIDSAQGTEWYNEEETSRAVREFGRHGVFVTTKIHPRNIGFLATKKAAELSLDRFGGHVDLLLLHYPRCWLGFCEIHSGETWKDSWRAMEELFDSGKVRAIGVSNFDEEDLSELISMARVVPHVMQTFSTPLHPNNGLLRLCKQHGIHFSSYSTLGGLRKGFKMIQEFVQDENESGSVARIAYGWALSHGMSILPRSENVHHLKDNLRASVLKRSDLRPLKTSTKVSNVKRPRSRRQTMERRKTQEQTRSKTKKR